MNLLHFAHAGEAQSFISHFDLTPVAEDSIYLGEKIIVQICGEGLYESMYKLGHTIAKYKIHRIVNIGIAGSLIDELRVNDIVEVKTSYAFGEISPKFNSYTTQDPNSKFDCISCEQRAIDPSYAKKITPFAHIVDRELWAVGKVSKYFKIPFSSIKLISDNAHSDVNCLEIKDKAQDYSLQLLDYYLEKNYEHKTQIQSDMIYPFTMTHYLKKKYEKTIRKLLKKNYSNVHEILAQINLKEITELKLREKEKSLALIEKIEELLNPIDKTIKKKINTLFKPLLEAKVDIGLDPKLEVQKFKLSKEINSQKNIDDLVCALKNFNFKKVEEFWQGDLDV